jgi:hypothetical protein
LLPVHPFVLFVARVYLSSISCRWVQWPKQLNAPLEEVDPEIADIIELEKARQWKVSAAVISNRCNEIWYCALDFSSGCYY